MTTKYQTCPQCSFSTLSVMTFANKTIEHCENCHYTKVMPSASMEELQKELVCESNL